MNNNYITMFKWLYNNNNWFQISNIKNIETTKNDKYIIIN